MCFRDSIYADISVFLSEENNPRGIRSSTWAIFVIKLTDEYNVQVKRGHFYGFVNTLCAKVKCILGYISLATKSFMSYCCSFYGCQLQDLSSTWIDAICVALNKVVRRIFQLPYDTHRFLLPYVADGISTYWWYMYSCRRSVIEALCQILWTMWRKQKLHNSMLVSNATFENITLI